MTWQIAAYAYFFVLGGELGALLALLLLYWRFRRR